MIGELLPAAAAVVEWVSAEPFDALLPEERDVTAEMVAHRREEFAVGRSCARRGLSALGQPMRPLLPGPDREPRWPRGFVGSITHCRGFCAAAVARAGDIATIGIDAEVNEPLPAGVLDQVALPAEIESMSAWTDMGICSDRLLFSAKESVFKAWFPLARQWLGFEDAYVRFDPATRTFEARLLIAAPQLGGNQVPSFRGRYHVVNGLVLTAIAVPG